MTELVALTAVMESKQVFLELQHTTVVAEQVEIMVIQKVLEV